VAQHRRMRHSFQTHEVENQPPPLVDVNLFETDHCLTETIAREGADWHENALRAFGARVGSAEVMALAEQANRLGPELRTHNRFGQRIDSVEFHPAWHALMTLAMTNQVHALAWNEPRPGRHVARAALAFLMNQAENGVCCPMAMTFASVPTLRHTPALAKEWEPRVRQADYDGRFMPAGDKLSATIGMAMTEKQGGSDVRANSTRAVARGAGGPGGEYALTGHKWFCSAPMSDAFLTLAYADGGLSCFLVPRWCPDGSLNRIALQRLKDKLGNRSNASAEIEYQEAFALMVGEEGRGVRTIIEMVHHTRLDAAVSAAAIMRLALAQAAHHAAHRSAFQKRLADQPLMQAVLADLAVESEAATMLVLRMARAFDEADQDEDAQGFARIGTAIAKYWICKRVPAFVFEALETHGGNGYVEESVMPRLYREAPVNSIWEGCGNVMCLDILRAAHKEPASLDAYFAELEKARGGDKNLDAGIDSLRKGFKGLIADEAQARALAGRMALLLQGALLIQHGDPAVAQTFCRSRLGADWGRAHGTLPSGLPLAAIVERTTPTVT